MLRTLRLLLVDGYTAAGRRRLQEAGVTPVARAWADAARHAGVRAAVPPVTTVPVM